MRDEVKQARFNALRAAERQGALTEAEGAELLALTQELDALEAAYLHPAIERVRQDREALGEQNLGFYHLSSFRCSDLGCWVYYENTLPSPPRSEHRPSIPCGGSRASSDPTLA